MNIIAKLIDKKLINPPIWVKDNLFYVTIVGSQAYGFSTDDSDQDIYASCITPMNQLFPHLEGYIYNFGPKVESFETYCKHHIDMDDKQYDITIHGIIKYFNLLIDNNPSQLETLFTPFNCVLYSNDVGKLLRDNRKLFLSKNCYHRFIGYSFSQLHKMKGDTREGKRKEVYEKFGWDVKYGCHCVRLLQYGKQILEEGDLDLQRGNEYLKAIRRGEVTEQEVRDWFSVNEKALVTSYENSKLPYRPDYIKIRQLLLNCLEHHYGSLSNVIQMPDKYESAVRDIKSILDKLGV